MRPQGHRLQYLPLYSFSDSIYLLTFAPFCLGLGFVTVSHYVTEAEVGLELATRADLKLKLFLHLTPKCWGYRHVPP